MLIFVLPVCFGAVIGWLRGGRLAQVSRIPLRLPALPLLALGVQASLVHLDRAYRWPLVLLTCAVGGGWIVLNMAGRPRPVRVAIGLVAAGWAMNVVVLAANGGMPVSERGLERLGVPRGYDVAEGHFFKHVAGDGRTSLRWLGDNLAVPPLRAVVSAGDVLLAVGIAALVAMAMCADVSRRSGPLPDAPGGGGSARRGHAPVPSG